MDTALNGIEQNFKIKVDHKRVKTLKLSYKGVPPSTVIRTPKGEVSCVCRDYAIVLKVCFKLQLFCKHLKYSSNSLMEIIVSLKLIDVFPQR